MNEIIIKPELIDIAVKNATGITLSPDGEKVLMDFIELKEKVELADKLIKESLEKALKDMNPNQKSVIGDHIKVTLKTGYETGKKYRLEGEYSEEFANRSERVYINPNTKSIDEYLKKNKHLPDGVKSNELKPQIGYECIN